MARVIDQLWEWIAIAIGLLLVLGGVLIGLLRGRGGRSTSAPTRRPDVLPGVGDDAEPPRDAPKRSIQDAGSVDTLPAPSESLPEPTTPTIERPEAPAGRLQRLRARLSRSN